MKSQEAWVDFDPRMPWRRGDLTICGNSYTGYINSLTWLSSTLHATPTSIRDEGEELGEYRFGHCTFPMRTIGATTAFGLPRMMRAGLDLRASSSLYYNNAPKAYFSTPVPIPLMCSKRGITWMSITPMEIFTQRPGLRYASGNVLIGGLGLGWFTHMVCLQKQARRVTVVEQEPALISRFGERLRKIHGDKLTLVEGDAYAHLQEHGAEYNAVLFDIWAEGYGAECDRQWLEYVKRIRPQKQKWWGWGCPRSIA